MTGRPAWLLAALTTAGCAIGGSGDPDPAADFRDTADRLAARTDRRVIAWGEAPIAEDRRPRRFAVLEPDDLLHDQGAYLVQDRTRYWLIEFSVDGRTSVWGLEPGEPVDGDARWQRRTDRAIEHAQTHPRGGERLEIALRRGALVVLTHDFLGEEATEVVERQRFADRGVCVDPCPPLAGFSTEDIVFEVTGPVRSPDAL